MTSSLLKEITYFILYLLKKCRFPKDGFDTIYVYRDVVVVIVFFDLLIELDKHKKKLKLFLFI